MNRYIVVKIKANRYLVAEENVRNQGAEFYCPRAMFRSPRTRALRPEPMFPGYAFVRPAGFEWRFLWSTRGIHQPLMGTGEQPAWTPAGYVEALRAREDEQGLVKLGAAEFVHGDQLVIEEGVMAGTLAIFDGMAPRDRVYVLVDLLGRKARVPVPAKAVSRA